MSDSENVEETTSVPEDAVVQSESEPTVEVSAPKRRTRRPKPKTKKIMLIRYGEWNGFKKNVVVELPEADADEKLAVRVKGAALFVEVTD